jgi:hypothetical protein
MTYLKSFPAHHSPVSIAVRGWALMKRLQTDIFRSSGRGNQALND